MEIARGVWQLSADGSTLSAVIRRAGRPPDTTADDGERHVWQSANFFTRERVTFDETADQITRVVKATPLLRVGGLAAVLLAVGARLAGREPVWLAATVLVLAHGMYLSTKAEMGVPDDGELVSYEVAPDLFLDFVVVVAIALTISVFNLVWKAALVTALAAYLLLHALQGSIRLGPFTVGTSRAAARFRLPAVVAASYCLAVPAYELTVLATRATASLDLPAQTTYAVGAVFAAVFGGYATLSLYDTFETTLQEVFGRPVDDTEPKWLRVVAAALFVVATGGNAVVVAYLADLVVFTTTGTRLFPGQFETEMLQRIPDAVAPFGSIAALPLQVLPFAPLLVTWLLGVRHFTNRIVARARLLRRAEPFDADLDLDLAPDAEGLAESPTVLVTDRDGITARPARTLRGKPVVVLHTDLVAELDTSEGELAAVVTHETDHLADGDQTVRLLATVATLLPAVGPNAIRVFRDYAAAEERADDAAVAMAGLGATMRAIRKVDDFQRNGPTERYRGLVGPEFVGPSVERLRNTYAESFTRLGVRRLFQRLALAYYVVFGRAVFDAVHAPVEARLSELQSRHSGAEEANTDGDRSVDERE
jgi:Zn-dependent protease with chaperone function